MNQKTKLNLTPVEQAYFVIRHKVAYILRTYAQQMSERYSPRPFSSAEKGRRFT
jgi:hypothetical protein